MSCSQSPFLIAPFDATRNFQQKTSLTFFSQGDFTRRVIKPTESMSLDGKRLRINTHPSFRMRNRFQYKRIESVGLITRRVKSPSD